MQNNQSQLIIRHHPFVYKSQLISGVVIFICCIIVSIIPPSNPKPQQPTQYKPNAKGGVLYQALYGNDNKVKTKTNKPDNADNGISIFFLSIGTLSLLLMTASYFIHKNTFIEINGHDARYKDFFKTINIKSFESIHVENLPFIPLSSRVLITGKGLNKIEMKYVDNIKTIQKYSEELQDINSLVR